VKCPSCNADVEEGADLCLECGEPMGDSPAARVARAEAPSGAGAGGNVIVPPAGTFKGGAPVAAVKPTAGVPVAGLKPIAGAPVAGAPVAGDKPVAAAPVAAKPSWRKWREEEPEPVRCPGCGMKTLAARCPSCGTKLRSDEG
jgi:hypothetical protein